MAYLRSWLVMMACFGMMWAGAFAARAGAARSNASGQCEGIGFGCTLTPYDGWTFAMVVLGVPLTFVALVAGSLWLRRRRPAGAVVRGLVAAVFGVAAALGALLVVAVVAALVGG